VESQKIPHSDNCSQIEEIRILTNFNRKILVVEPNRSLAQLIVHFFSQKNYQVELSSDIPSTLTIFDKFQPELAIVDVNLSDGLAYSLCESLRSRSNIFILLLSNDTDIESKKKAFESGVDDYLIKPFDLEELEYRVKALLKRQILELDRVPQTFNFSNLTISPEGREVVIDDRYVVLTNLEFALLQVLALYPGKVWTREELFQQVWRSELVGSIRTIDVHIKNLRQKLETDRSCKRWIQTVRGVGYRFEASEMN
jgi:two-component system, OmpR family, response regulator